MEANVTLTSGIHREAEGRSAWGHSDCKETVNKPQSVQRLVGLRWKQRFCLALTHITVSQMDTPALVLKSQSLGQFSQPFNGSYPATKT